MRELSAAVLLLGIALATGQLVPKLHLSDVEYNKLPKLFTLEHYEECLVPPDAAFCLATFELSAPQPSELYDNIKIISDGERFNYNHTKLYRGVCVTKSCKKFLSSSSLDLEVLAPAFEACVNESVNKEYGLEAKIESMKYCKRTGETLPLDWTDYLFVVVTAVLILLNVSGTIYDVYLRKPNESGIPWLMAFSIRISWGQLIVIRGLDEGDPRLHNLSPIQGLRTLTMSLVMMSHVLVIAMFRYPPDNPRLMELAPYSIFSTILFNGHFVMQTFMVMASFLVAYNFLIFRETKKCFSCRYFWEAILQRFLRLTPAYMYVISMTATWGSRFTSGPLCHIIEEERQVCRNKWWLHLFYIHNVVKANNVCLPQSWYIGADFQLFILGMTLLAVLWRYPNLTRRLLIACMLLATVTQFCLIYFLRLRPPILMQSPDRLRNLFAEEPSWKLLHTSFQGNLQGYILGLTLGMTYYKWEKEGFRVYEKKWFRFMNYISFPLGLFCVLAGFPFLMMEPENHFLLALYAMIDRISFAFCISILMLGCFYKVDTLYYRILVWRGWQPLGRLTYGVMLLHTSAFLNMSCSIQYPRAIGFYVSMNEWLGNLVVSYVLAVPLTLMLEYPLQRLQKVILQGSPSSRRRKQVQETNGKKKE